MCLMNEYEIRRKFWKVTNRVVRTSKHEEYTANSVQELDEHQHILKRPSLILGEEAGHENNPYSTQKRTCVREIYENSVDEGLQGYATRINVTFYPDGSFEVYDNGRGIPVDINKKTGKSGIMATIGTLRSGRNFDSYTNRKSTGTNGLGASAVAVFSNRLDVTVYRNKKQYRLSFKNGKPGFFAEDNNPASAFTPLDDVSYLQTDKDARPADEKKLFPTGTRIRVWLNDDVFSVPYSYDRAEIIERLRATAYLVPGVTIQVTNHTEGDTETFVFSHDGGVKELTASNLKSAPLADVVAFTGETTYTDRATVVSDGGKVETKTLDREVTYQVGFTYTKRESVVKSYVNTIFTQDNGIHVTAFERALMEVLNEKIRRSRLIPKGYELPSLNDYREGLNLTVAVTLQEPGFTGQSKDKLTGSKVQNTLLADFATHLKRWVAGKANTKTVELFCKKVVDTAVRRQKDQDAQDLKKVANELSGSPLPEKLKDCERSSGGGLELYICEGDSALSTLMSARFSEYQAVLPVRGKTMNANNYTLKKLMSNAEVQGIINTLGAGFGDNFDVNKMRYDRVFIAVDADEDGNNIACLLYVLFWHLFRPALEDNRLFMLQTPLFVFSNISGVNKDERVYALNETEKDELVKKFKSEKRKYTISRMKGLGEMNPDDMSVTSMDRRTRNVIQIEYGDPQKILETIDKLFSDKQADQRKQWLIDAGMVDQDFVDVDDAE